MGRCEVLSSKDNSIRQDLTVQMELYVEVSRCTDGSTVESIINCIENIIF